MPQHSKKPAEIFDSDASNIKTGFRKNSINKSPFFPKFSLRCPKISLRYNKTIIREKKYDSLKNHVSFQIPILSIIQVGNKPMIKQPNAKTSKNVKKLSFEKYCLKSITTESNKKTYNSINKTGKI